MPSGRHSRLAASRIKPYKDEERDLQGNNNPRFGTRDPAKLQEAQKRRDELKEALQKGIEDFQLEKYRKSEESIKAIKNKHVKAYYQRQNDRLNDWLEVDNLVKFVSDDVLDSMNPDADHDGEIDIDAPLRQQKGDIDAFLPQEVREERQKNKRKANIALNVNVAANILLLIAKIIAVFSSGSLSLIASLTDSALDLLCTMIIWTTSVLVGWKLHSLQAKFPVGRRKLESLGVLVFSIIMVTSFIQILQESVKKLLPSGKHDVVQLSTLAISAMGGNAVVKGVIGLGCMRIKTNQVQALVQDCWTDVIFNTASLLFPLIGHKFNIWWLDPLGASVLSLYIIYDWASTCLENVSRLTGVAADERIYQKLTYLGWRFSKVIDGFKSITAYHAGDGVWAEYDILLKEDTPLHRAHDISETLQYCAEGLQEVDRAFVTADYAEKGPSGHDGGSG